MKQQMSIYSRQQGFTLLEALIALIILSIVVIGSGVALNQMLKTQRASYVDGIIIDQMQARLQGAIGNPSSTTNLCGSIDTSVIPIDGQNYAVGCATQPITVNGATINWPVLAAVTESAAGAGDAQARANGCANGSAILTECYIVGK